jgi:hypothetical protein
VRAGYPRISLRNRFEAHADLCPAPRLLQDCSFPAYFYTQPMATGPGFYDNLCPQSWQDGSAATFTLNDPHQQSEQPAILMSVFCQERPQATVACAVCPVVAFR